MSDNTGIEWCDATWNPVTGCTEVSPGCDRCYAKTFAERWRGTPGHYFEQGFEVQLRPDKLDQPLRWKRPRRIFVNSMSDLFHDSVPDEYIAQVFAVMARAPRHTFQVLTKRHARMRALLSRSGFWMSVYYYAATADPSIEGMRMGLNHPLPNVWLGVSAENQQWADIRIPALLHTPAAVRFVSAEPLLGPIDLGAEECDHHRRSHAEVGCWRGLDWVIVGGESGHGARPMHPWWAESLQCQCESSGVPYLFKQWGEWTPLAPLDAQGRCDFSNGICMTDDGNQYLAGDLTYPDGPLRGQANRADFPHRHPTSMYRVGKKRAGRELYHDGRTWDEYPETVHAP